MKVWVVEVGENLPIDPGPPRLMRAGLLSRTLSDRGHDVTWFTSAFNHYRKLPRPVGQFDVDTPSGRYQLVTLASPGYSRHVSVARLRDHRANAREFRREARRRPAPDVICAGLPTLDLAAASADVAADFGIPLLVDVRDLWPDIFLDAVPRALRHLATPLLTPMRRAARTACTSAAGIVGVSSAFRDWGLSHAARSAGHFDRVFPLAYEPVTMDAAKRHAARTFWSDLGVDLDQPVISFVGSHVHTFELSHIVDTAKRFLVSSPEVQFVLAGEGPLRDSLMAAARDLGNVFVPGWLDAQQIAALLEATDVALAPYIPRSDFEANISNKIFEYLAAGLPIATTLTRGATATLLNDASIGLSYEPRGSELDTVLSQLLKQTGCYKDAGLRARKLFRDNFSATTVYGSYSDLLEELVLRNHER